MTDLTEQWKKGELPKGEEYWVILTDEWYLRNPVKPVRAFYSCDCEFEGYLDDDIKEVLAPLPSYDEWEKLNWYAGNGVEENQELKMENKQFKELLKKWVQFEIEENPNDFTVISERMSELANKTNQALGEDK